MREAYPSEETQSVYYTAPAEWAKEQKDLCFSQRHEVQHKQLCPGFQLGMLSLFPPIITVLRHKISIYYLNYLSTVKKVKNEIKASSYTIFVLH